MPTYPQHRVLVPKYVQLVGTLYYGDVCLVSNTLHGFGLQVIKAPNSPAEDAMLVVQKGFMQVSVSMNEIQKRKPK